MSPAGQPLCNKGTHQVMSDQTNDGWLTLHACRVHSGVSVFKEKLPRIGKREWKSFSISQKAFFNLLETSVKSCVSLHGFRVDTDSAKPAVNWGMLSVSGGWGNIVLHSELWGAQRKVDSRVWCKGEKNKPELLVNPLLSCLFHSFVFLNYGSSVL